MNKPFPCVPLDRHSCGHGSPTAPPQHSSVYVTHTYCMCYLYKGELTLVSLRQPLTPTTQPLTPPTKHIPKLKQCHHTVVCCTAGHLSVRSQIMCLTCINAIWIYGVGMAVLLLSVLYSLHLHACQLTYVHVYTYSIEHKNRPGKLSL